MARHTGNLTIRLDAETLARLDARCRRAGETKSRLAQRYIAEGMEMEEHPGVAFRDGPGGRRPGLASGPDVWQVIGVLRGSGKKGESAIRHTAEWLGLGLDQVRAAIGYYVTHTEEIDDWIRRNDEEAEAAETAWLREQELFA
jgi:predicted transcriptional regulator